LKGKNRRQYDAFLVTDKQTRDFWADFFFHSWHFARKRQLLELLWHQACRHNKPTADETRPPCRPPAARPARVRIGRVGAGNLIAASQTGFTRQSSVTFILWFWKSPHLHRLAHLPPGWAPRRRPEPFPCSVEWLKAPLLVI
jgi:hypothetical protein